MAHAASRREKVAAARVERMGPWMKTYITVARAWER